MTAAETAILNKAIKNEAIGLYGTYGRAKIMALLEVSPDEVSIFVNNGFFDFLAIPVSADKEVVYRYYSLNERWRNLKKCGDYDTFVLWEKGEIISEEERKTDAELYLKYQAENAQWQKVLNPLIKEANESTILTNKYIRIANRNLIVIFLVTAFITCLSFVVSAINLFRDSKVQQLTHKVDTKDSVIYQQDRMIQALQSRAGK